MEWENILEEKADALVLYARQWADCHADAEEAVQNGFVRFWKSRLYDGKTREEMTALLYIAVKRSAQDLKRSAFRRAARETKASEDVPVIGMFEMPEEDKGDAGKIEEALSEIEPDQREVVVMKIWGDLTFKAIAANLGVSENTVASRYRYALDKLRKKLGGVYEDQ